MILTISTIVLICYLIGSIPFGFLIAKCAGVDIRTLGSGNIGATNVVRSLGKKYGYPVFLLDFLKGFAAVKLAELIGSRPETNLSMELAGIVGGICSVVGHSYPIWLGFKGGKGVATSGGVVFGLMPMVALIAAGVWILIFQITRFVSLASIAAVISIPCACAAMLALGYLHSRVLLYFSIAIAAIVIVRHHSNLYRLAHGQESRFERK